MSTGTQKSFGLVVAVVATLGVLADANAATRVLRITNVRVNANGITGGGPIPGNPVAASRVRRITNIRVLANAPTF